VQYCENTQHSSLQQIIGLIFNRIESTSAESPTVPRRRRETSTSSHYIHVTSPSDVMIRDGRRTGRLDLARYGRAETERRAVSGWAILRRSTCGE